MYRFEFRFDRKIKEFVSSLQEKFPHVDTRYIERYNDICPECREPVKQYNGELRGLNSVSVFFPNANQLMAIPYCLCNKCSKKMARLSEIGFGGGTGSEIEEYIEEKLIEEKDREYVPQMKEVNVRGLNMHYYNNIGQKRIEERLETFAKRYEGSTINTDLLNYFNDNCPCCRKEFQNIDGVIYGADGVNAHVDEKNKVVIPFAICEDCSSFFAEFTSKRVNARRYRDMLDNMKRYVWEKLYEGDMPENYIGRI